MYLLNLLVFSWDSIWNVRNIDAKFTKKMGLGIMLSIDTDCNQKNADKVEKP